MASTAPTTARPLVASDTTTLKPLLARSLKYGLSTGLAMVFIGAIGMLDSFDGRALVVSEPFGTRTLLSLGYLLLIGIPFFTGWMLSRSSVDTPPDQAPTPLPWWIGGQTGLIAGLLTILFAWLIATVDFTEFLPNLMPSLTDLYAFHLNHFWGYVLLLLLSALAGTAGQLLRTLHPGTRRRVWQVGAWWLVMALFELVVTDLLEVIEDPLDNMLNLNEPITGFVYGLNGGLTIWGLLLIGAAVVACSNFWGGVPAQVRRRIQRAQEKNRLRTNLWLGAVVLVVTIILPQMLGGIVNELLTNVGLFLLMALGLNIVVGLAGLLDLGYVAFFAVGAYTTAILTSPISPQWNPELGFWLALPAALIMGMIAGIFVGTPVIRMRGDYLAIVTLGFGEIVRIVLLSDWLSGFFGGAQGVRNIPGIPLFGTEINAADPNVFVYFVIGFVLLAAYVSWRVQNSRIGRAWAAMREDEDVAEAVGISTVQAKLLAFIIGAMLASLGGALFAAKVGSVFTHSFSVLVSIIILVVVIVGGMGNIPGVVVGSLVMIGILGGPNQPGLLQEFGEYKLLIYGAVLVLMMLVRPAGLLPSVRCSRELAQDEVSQDAWLNKEEREPDTALEPAI